MSSAGLGNAVKIGTSGVPKLDGTNFESWREMVSIVLTLRGLRHAVEEGGRVDVMEDLQAKLIIMETMTERKLGAVDRHVR